MRSLQESANEGNEQAQLAITLFCYVLAKQLAGLATALPQIDALIFTGGIGENASAIREQVIDQLSVFGLSCNKQLNDNNGCNSNGLINDNESPLIAVITTNEELMIAHDTAAIALP